MIKWVIGMNSKVGTESKEWDQSKSSINFDSFKSIIDLMLKEKKEIMLGGGLISIQKQHDKNRMTARERIDYLLDNKNDFLEIGIYAGNNMYKEYGSPAAGGVITGIGKVDDKDCMIVANDATVKAGAYFEITVKKTLRAQKIALENNIPIIYLVDSAGAFLPLQDQVFPDETHFGRIFFNNARLSALGITQIAVVMGPCVAGGAYLPVMCDKYIIVEGASMFLAGPALVKAAIGQNIDQETLGGANTHSAISGTVDYHEKDDISALDKAKELLTSVNFKKTKFIHPGESKNPRFSKESIISLFDPISPNQYDIIEIIARIVDDSCFNEFKKNYGKTLVCGTARLGGFPIGIVANQRKIQKNELGQLEMGGVIYSDSADKAARFIMNCNQDRIPLLFIHDVNGFMVGKTAEWGGIAKDGAKMVNAVSNSVVPKISLVIGGSYGAGNYAMSGRAYSPRFMFAWPSAKIAVMGGHQSANTLLQIKLSKMGEVDEEVKNKLYHEIKSKYDEHENYRYGAARMWVDEIINPLETRDVLIKSLHIINNRDEIPSPNFGVLQV